MSQQYDSDEERLRYFNLYSNRLKSIHPQLVPIELSADHRYLLCKDEFGIVRINVPRHIRNRMPYTMDSAVDKISYWRNLMTKINGDNYDYSKSEYKGRNIPVIIICRIHGEFLQRPNDHTSKKSGCPQCGNISRSITKTKNTKQFIANARKIHGNKYSYSETIYSGQRGIVIIRCPIHGKVSLSAYTHLHSSGCTKCGKELNRGKHCVKLAKRNIELYKTIPCIVYIIKCFSDTESFYKIGITKNKLSCRTLMFPYQTEIVKIINTNLLNAIFTEKSFLVKLMKHKYTPLKKFGGHSECFSSIKSIIKYE